jgi:predicted acylesterase/phospholipase RssA
MKDVTLVCGGGGVWGVAWMTGIAAGLAEAGLDLREAASFIGTSAGSIIGAQLASGLDPQHLFARQADPSKQPYELSPDLSGMTGTMELMPHVWACPGKSGRRDLLPLPPSMWTRGTLSSSTR